MSGDQSASSFGAPNAQPPTPKQTPTSAVFPSPVFETPKNRQSHFDEAGGWTPRFAEEYSVFNTTPGNLRGTQGPFVDFAPQTPHQGSTGHKRPLSAGGIAAEIAAHANHFSSSPNLPLPPVDCSKQLQSSPGLLTASSEQTGSQSHRSSAQESEQEQEQERSPKKVRRGPVFGDTPGQTATPPPSAHKRDRKLAPKLDNNTMQDEQDFSQPDFSGASGNMGVFGTSPNDMFGYPLSAPATAGDFTDQRTFWDPSADLNSMDIDFNNGSNVFQNSAMSHKSMGSMDWGKANQMFQETGVAPDSGQENTSPTKRGRLLAPKPMSNSDGLPADRAMFALSFSAGVADPFGIVGNGAVDPDLLCNRPHSSSMDTIAFSASMHGPSMEQAHHVNTQVPVVPMGGELRRPANEREIGPGKQTHRTTGSSPVKMSGRPGLSRSFSENRGRKALPTLAPAAPRSQIHGPASASSFCEPSRSVVTQPHRPAGRSSPSKNLDNRLSSLSSIPESTGPRTRTEARFTIDANGHARVETTLVVIEDSLQSSVRKRHSTQRRWNLSDEDDDSSSTDDEPIIIPSRNTSFALPDSRRPASTHPFHHSSHSISDHSRNTSRCGGSQDDHESEAETVVNDLVPIGKVSGDAASELQKLRESRQSQASARKSRDHVPRLNTTGFTSSYSTQDIMSPTTLTDTSLPTPSTQSRRSIRVRCICNRPEVDQAGMDFMVLCESCELWLHSRCVNVSKRATVSSIFICAFCASTPVARGSHARDSARMSNAMRPPAPATSPLAHKSFKSFR